MYPEVANKVTGAVVFQSHIPGRQNRNWASEFRLAIEEVEKKLANELEIYARSRRGFSFELRPLQGPDEGTVEPDIDYEMDGGDPVTRARWARNALLRDYCQEHASRSAGANDLSGVKSAF